MAGYALRKDSDAPGQIVLQDAFLFALPFEEVAASK